MDERTRNADFRASMSINRTMQEISKINTTSQSNVNGNKSNTK